MAANTVTLPAGFVLDVPAGFSVEQPGRSIPAGFQVETLPEPDTHRLSISTSSAPSVPGQSFAPAPAPSDAELIQSILNPPNARRRDMHDELQWQLWNLRDQQGPDVSRLGAGPSAVLSGNEALASLRRSGGGLLEHPWINAFLTAIAAGGVPGGTGAEEPAMTPQEMEAFRQSLQQTGQEQAAAGQKTMEEIARSRENAPPTLAGSVTGPVTGAVVGMSPFLLAGPLGTPAVAGTAGAMSLGSSTEDQIAARMAQGKTREQAISEATVPAIVSGAISTAIFGLTGGQGVGAITKLGPETLSATVGQVLKHAGIGASQMAADTIGQDIVRRATIAPNLSVEQIASDAVRSAIEGGLIVGATGGLKAGIGYAAEAPARRQQAIYDSIQAALIDAAARRSMSPENAQQMVDSGPPSADMILRGLKSDALARDLSAADAVDQSKTASDRSTEQATAAAGTAPQPVVSSESGTQESTSIRDLRARQRAAGQDQARNRVSVQSAQVIAQDFLLNRPDVVANFSPLKRAVLRNVAFNPTPDNARNFAGIFELNFDPAATGMPQRYRFLEGRQPLTTSEVKIQESAARPGQPAQPEGGDTNGQEIQRQEEGQVQGRDVLSEPTITNLLPAPETAVPAGATTESPPAVTAGGEPVPNQKGGEQTSDQENQQGLPGGQPQGPGTEQTQSVQEPGNQTVEGSGVLQAGSPGTELEFAL